MHRTESSGLPRPCSILRLSCRTCSSTMSPGRVAVPLGMFSQAGTTTVRLIGRFRLANRRHCADVPWRRHTCRISFRPLPAPGFREMPPVSNVTRLCRPEQQAFARAGAFVLHDNEFCRLNGHRPSRTAKTPCPVSSCRLRSPRTRVVSLPYALSRQPFMRVPVRGKQVCKHWRANCQGLSAQRHAGRQYRAACSEPRAHRFAASHRRAMAMCKSCHSVERHGRFLAAHFSFAR